MADNAQLLSHLKKEFEIVDGEIRLRGVDKIKFKYTDKQGAVQDGELPVEYVFCQGFKSKDKIWITNVMKMITYPGLMLLKDLIGFELVPFADGGFYRFESPETVMVQVKAQDCVWPVCGEAKAGTLTSSMRDYPATMAVKRAVGRAVMQASGLYSKGFYTEDEWPGDGDEAARTPPVIRSADGNERQRRETLKNNLIACAKALGKQDEHAWSNLKKNVAEDHDMNVDDLTATKAPVEALEDLLERGNRILETYEAA